MSLEDQLCSEFLKNKDENKAENLMKSLIKNSDFKTGTIIGEFLSNEFKTNYNIIENYALCCYKDGLFEKAYDAYDKILNLKNLSEKYSLNIIFKQQSCLEKITNRYIHYDKTKVNNILKRNKKETPLITFTITTCKRLDLFKKTMNSILNCFEDLDMVDYFFCIDDNSSEEDRKEMSELYPFFTFYFKNQEEKGHIKSMNIIRNHVLNVTQTPYILHLEDDWRFFCKKNYITDAFDVLNENQKIGQCLFNKNYIETEPDIVAVKGGDYNVTKNGLRYYIHEYNDTSDKQVKWLNKHGIGLSSSYWPHFSLRPSLMRSKVLKEVGEFNLKASHFEMEYAHRYVNLEYISAFFENIYCIHMGRLTSQIGDKNAINAYSLNNEKQFFKEEEKEVKVEKVFRSLSEYNILTYVLNLDRRVDRWNNFLKLNDKELAFLNYKRFSAIDGTIIKSTTQLQRIFNNNDYNMQVGMVGCLMSHVKMYIELINSTYDAFCILEDDIEVTTDFHSKFLNVLNQTNNIDWDLIYLGHHLQNLNDIEYSYNKNIIPSISKSNVFNSFKISLGGTIGYLITKKGAKKLLDFISKTGATNCIDTLQQKSANILNLYYCNPHLVYSECWRGDNNTRVDTDIQGNLQSLTIPFNLKVENELEFFKEHNLDIKKYDFDNLKTYLLDHFIEEFFAYTIDTQQNIQYLKNICNKKSLKYYDIENKAIFVFFSTENIERYCHSFKIDNNYSIKDCF